MEKATLEIKDLEPRVPRSAALGVASVLSLAEKYAFNLQETDGHWCGEFATCTYATCEYIFFCQAHSIDISSDAGLFQKWLLSKQERRWIIELLARLPWRRFSIR